MKPDLKDIFFFSGLFLTAVGLKLIFTPAAFIIPGLFFIWMGLRR